MKNFIYKSLFAFILLGFVACDDFGDIDIDPNKPTQVAPATLLTNAEQVVSSVVGSALGELYAQHMAEITYTEGSRYQDIQADFSGWYTGALQDLQRVIDLNTDPETMDAASISGPNENQIAAAKILQYFFLHHLTDRWGPLPWSEALQAEIGIITPTFDSQEAIYDAIFSGLKEATAMIDESAGSIDGDFILGGDMAKWKQFANTIRMVAALRISDVAAGKAETEFNSAVADGILTETLYYPYLAETANQNPWYARFITRSDYALTEIFVNNLMDLNDPRLESYADPATTPGIGIVGMPYGLANSDVNPENVSFPNSVYVKAQDAPIAIYSLAQINFSLAEAAARGWTNGDAEALYREGIMASWEQWGVSGADFDAYYAQPEVTYSADMWKEKIGYQKWVALYLQGYEAWAEYRRLDEPSQYLIVPEEPFNASGEIPMRNVYANDIANLNASGYEEALRLLGGPDSDGTQLWWDVN
ncbi:SusD/RagB family nutrient-binding outer membrane lipoprotein [Flavilitoribacter nigricans]|uniref:SusD/RagB family nutrient-binding outer membrane lipoprotein n=1 Tax=Flavilitoribacter nigricans (strain ATCC 23147 / DSM 23189 / NBRC 102662 / NCIMB 1420 / SS-2) TaxID=1122177 RepID=A0A2D0NFG3_FLAN2|nr:SusD/RagB family nutrient-binding outer membrane lipoprotein [Flavilitoribacter nigricans]PHN07225.1 SusD/RagB family nutrient-binding outer membrane lipoprotein [Flavilitoribacter nigricans DSM 23189 = NBRC 102662]